MQQFQQPAPQQRPADQGLKMAAIIFFVIGFFLHVIGALTLFILIGFPILIIAFCCDIIAFVCLCFI